VLFNCLSIRAFDLIRTALRRFDTDPSVRAVLLRAQGKNFCTGAELGGGDVGAGITEQLGRHGTENVDRQIDDANRR
jgi:enoyl-CoA hydratase/carnithine racemase